MTAGTQAILLGLFSALTVAVANMLVKRGGDILAGRAVLSITSAALLVPFAFMVPLPSAAVWTALAFAIPAHMLYQFSLVRAMHRGDLSLVFPVMRGSAPLLTALFAVFILNEPQSALSWTGLCLTVLAVISFALPEGQAASRVRPDAQALIWSGMTALGIALYSVADARGMRLAENPFTYIVWLFLLDFWGLLVVLVVARRGRVLADMRRAGRGAVLAGILSIFSFGAFLLALRLTDAAHASALRETSVLIAALLGWLVLKEPLGPRRTAAALVVVLGLVLMRLGHA